MSIDQTLPLFSNTQSNPSSQEFKGNGSASSGAVPPKENTPLPVDTVSISTQSLQTITDARKEAAKKKEALTVINGGKTDQAAAAKVEVVYDQKGALITKYMDTADRLIYQTPSELTLLLRETVTKPDSSVDTKV
jgi:hypothetical protein